MLGDTPHYACEWILYIHAGTNDGTISEYDGTSMVLLRNVAVEIYVSHLVHMA